MKVYKTTGGLMREKINLLVITNLFPNPQEPLRGNFVASMVEELKSSCNLTVISPLPWFPRGKFFQKFGSWYKFSLIPEKFEFSGIEVICPKFFAPPKLGFVHPIFMFFSILPHIIKVKVEKKIDLINAHWLFPDGVAAFWASRIVSLPLVLSAHGCDLNHYTKFRLRAFQIINALKSAEAVTVVSQAQKIVAQDKGVDSFRICVTQNGVDLQRFIIREKKQCKQKLGLEESKRIILFVGQLVEVKGINYLLEAVKLLDSHNVNNFQVVILGEGNLRGKLEAMVLINNLEDKVKMIGNRSYDEIPYWIGAADLLCLPSLREGCPCVVVESLACGRPVVASKVGGIPDLVNSKNGILVDSRDSKKLAEGLKVALQKHWDADEIRKSVQDLSWKTVAMRYYSTFKHLFLNNKEVN